MDLGGISCHFNVHFHSRCVCTCMCSCCDECHSSLMYREFGKCFDFATLYSISIIFIVCHKFHVRGSAGGWCVHVCVRMADN